MEDDKSEISNKVEEQKEAEKNVARKAWRATMLGAVGSLAFFLSTLGNLSRTAKTHGNPVKHLEKHDIALFSVPILVIGYFVIESLKNGEESTNAS
tara:strand:+ start:861 stop:1148 length:288 start_codon:yes stop_codon:yes gene_type:complete